MTDLATLDRATRAFRDKNPLRWPCACIGCEVTIRMNYRLLSDGALGRHGTNDRQENRRQNND